MKHPAAPIPLSPSTLMELLTILGMSSTAYIQVLLRDVHSQTFMCLRYPLALCIGEVRVQESCGFLEWQLENHAPDILVEAAESLHQSSVEIHSRRYLNPEYREIF